MLKNKTGRKKIAVLTGGPSPEHEVSLKRGQNVIVNLNPDKYEVREIRVGKTGEWPVSPEDIKKLFDLAFIAMHGPYGEDGTVQGILGAVHMPYTGSGAMVSALGMNKWLSLRLFQDAGLLIPPTIHLSRNVWLAERDGVSKKIKSYLGKPWVIKPNASGSSLGVKIVKEEKDLKQALEFTFKDFKEIIVQEFIPGREFTCGVIDSSIPGSAFVLPPTEIVAVGSAFFDYKAKYEPKGAMEITPARLPNSFLQAIKRTALKAHKVLGCRGFSRSDFILNPKGRLYILEINTIPGLTENSLLPKAAKAINMSMSQLLEIVIEGALLR
ncbi:D-alanine--D-alanine ligase [bacterium]|nr:MAG: D-alanine--D-alanine ligase [bacterium]